MCVVIASHSIPNTRRLDSGNSIKYMLPLLVVAIIFSPRIPLGAGEEGRYLSINLEDVVVFYMVSAFFLRKMLMGDWSLKIRAKAISLTLVMLTSWLFISVLIAGFYIESKSAWLLCFLWLVKWLEYSMLFFVLQEEITDYQLVRRCTKILLFCGFAISIISIVQFLTGNLAGRLGESRKDGFGSFFFNPNTAGAFFFIFGLMFLSFYLSYSRNTKRLYLLIGFIVSVIAILLTGSRSAAIAFMVGFTVLVFMKKKAVGKGIVWIGMLSVILMVFLFIAFNYTSDYQLVRWTKIFSSTSQGITFAANFASIGIKARIARLGVAWDLFSESPLMGKGYFSTLQYYLDNQYLIHLVELGIVGFVITSLFYISIFRFLNKVRRYSTPIALASFSIYGALMLQSIAGPIVTTPRILGLLFLFLFFSLAEIRHFNPNLKVNL